MIRVIRASPIGRPRLNSGRPVISGGQALGQAYRVRLDRTKRAVVMRVKRKSWSGARREAQGKGASFWPMASARGARQRRGRCLEARGRRRDASGRFPVRQVLYRADRMKRPRTPLPVRAIREHDGWCEDPTGRNDNRNVTLSSRSSAERLNRDDHLYDLVLVLGQLTARGSGNRQRHLRALARPVHADRGLHRARPRRSR